jgi:hypothetical protein
MRNRNIFIRILNKIYKKTLYTWREQATMRSFNFETKNKKIIRISRHSNPTKL